VVTLDLDRAFGDLDVAGILGARGGEGQDSGPRENSERESEPAKSADHRFSSQGDRVVRPLPAEWQPIIAQRAV
jgi:hypothetical protein